MWLLFNRAGLRRTLPASTPDHEVLEGLQRHDRAELWLDNASEPKRTLKPPHRVAPRIPACTCHVRMATGKDLPDCPRGLASGNHYATWDDVPNDALLPDKYEARNGHPPPTCPTCGNWAYECEPECRYCRVYTLIHGTEQEGVAESTSKN